MKQIRGEYDDLAHYVSTARPKAAMKAIKRFMDAYPEYGDPQELMQKFRPMPIIEQSTSKEIPKSKPATTKTKSTISSEKILPQPFAWVEIPGGKGIMTTYDSDITLKIPSEKYWIAKYPVTNAQFAKFMEAGGYHQQKWWTEEGWSYRQKEKWTQPLYWRHSDYNGAEKPVVGVSWFESVAFCLWLSDETGEKIMLPTDEQWQFAAQGTDNRAYPWGNTWNPNLCQNNFSGRIGTSPVTQYENKFRNFLGFGNINDGTSPFGVVDMVGNVWEWCVTDSDKKTDDINASAFRRVFRGGCWYDINLDMFRCDHRSRNFPHERMYVIGFRLSHSS
ncbi:MAG: formylglycine-generating enzyme family protein [Chloroflexota bacterium]